MKFAIFGVCLWLFSLSVCLLVRDLIPSLLFLLDLGLSQACEVSNLASSGMSLE